MSGVPAIVSCLVAIACTPPPSTRAPRESIDSIAVGTTESNPPSAYLTRRVAEWNAHPPQVGNNFACATTCHTSLAWAVSAPETAWQSATGQALIASIASRIDSVDDLHDAVPYYGEPHSIEGVDALASEAALNAWIVSYAHPDPRASDLRDKAIAQMWSMQRADGGLDWMDYDLAPWEDGDELIAAAFAGRTFATGPDRHAANRQRLAAFARSRVDGARPFSVAFAVWAFGDEQPWGEVRRASLLAALARLANRDGAYSWKAMGVGSLEEADPMPTAIMLLALCSAPRSAGAFDVTRAVEWLRRWQTGDGSFPSHSPNRDRPFNHMLATDVATGYSLLALARCSHPP